MRKIRDTLRIGAANHSESQPSSKQARPERLDVLVAPLDKYAMHLGNDSPRGQVRLSRTRALEEFGHLWIYAGYVEEVGGEPASGDVVDVIASNGRFYARGLYNPASKIRVRILTFDDEPITEQFWRRRLAQAVRLRRCLVTGTSAYRLVYGEADRLPGLIVDRYDDVLVMQTLSSGMDCRKDLLADLLCQESGATRVYLRNDAKSRTLEGLPMERGFLRGSGATTVEIQEGPARFLVDIERGQKTGWFCDQRENRLVTAQFAVGAEVLEVFAHTGAFGIHAALAGAKSGKKARNRSDDQKRQLDFVWQTTQGPA